MKALVGVAVFLVIVAGATLAAITDDSVLRVCGLVMIAIPVGYVVATSLRERRRRQR